jgi:hypothetical protein
MPSCAGGLNIPASRIVITFGVFPVGTPVEAALLVAQPDKRLLKAYLEIKGADQRYKREPEA